MERTRRQPLRLGPRGEFWFDVLLATALLVPTPVYLIESYAGDTTHGLLPLLFCVAEIVPLHWRRRHPVLVFAAVAAAHAVQAMLVDVSLYGQVAFPVAVYSIARFSTAAAGFASLAVGFAGAIIASYTWLDAADDLFVNAFVTYVLTMTTVVVAAWALGALRRVRQAYIDELLERNERTRREAEQRVALATADERTRIAREMHDVVAHGLSVIVVQADGARYAAQHDPESAPTALATISDTARAALADMRRTLGLLRSAAFGTAPQPRVADVPVLIEQHRSAGTPVHATLPDSDSALSDGVALTAYRIVQEALSNVRKHAGPGATATVVVDVGSDAVYVEVSDDGRGAAADGDGQGLGLLGMRERVGAHDGQVEAGPAAGGGFRVWARIPL